jgi:hypothetical protein
LLENRNFYLTFTNVSLNVNFIGNYPLPIAPLHNQPIVACLAEYGRAQRFTREHKNGLYQDPVQQ